MKTICIVGKKRTGKTTIAQIIKSNYESYEYALAQPIKKVLYDNYVKFEFDKESHQVLYLSDFDGDGFDREQPINLSTKQIAQYLTQCVYDLIDNYGLKMVKNPTIKNHEIEDLITSIVQSQTFYWSVRRFMQILGTDIVVNHFDTVFWNRLMLQQFANKSNMYFEYFIVPDIRQDHEYKLMRDMGATIIFVEKPSINNDTNDLHITEQGIEPEAHDIVIKNDGTIEDLENKILKVLKNDNSN